MKKNKKNDKSISDSLENSKNTSIRELEIRALRAKNKKLAQSFAALQSNNAELQMELNSMKTQFFDVSCKLANFDSIHTTIGTTVKESIPMLAKLSSMFSQLLHLISIGNAINHRSSSGSSVASRESRTQAVKPQIVNGHVLLNPTINLLRITNNVAANDNNTGNVSASVAENEQDNNIDENEGNGSSSNEENTPDNVNTLVDQVYIRNNISVQAGQETAVDNPEEDYNEMSDEDNADESNEIIDENEENRCNYDLYTLHEENEEMQLSHVNIREIRIPLEPLSHSILFNNMKKLSKELGKSFENSHNNTTIGNLTKDNSDNHNDENMSSSSTPDTLKICLKRGQKSVLHKTKNNNDDASLSSVNNERVCLRRGNRVYHQNETADSFDSFLPLPYRASDYSRESSLINNVTSEEEETTLLDECVGFCNDLSLNTREPRLKTSTPIVPENIGRERTLFRRTMNPTTASLTNSTSSREETPKPFPIAIRPRTSLEKRLSGSPIKKVGDILDDVRITRSSISRRESIVSAAKRRSNSSSAASTVFSDATTSTTSRRSSATKTDEESQKTSLDSNSGSINKGKKARPTKSKKRGETVKHEISTRPKRAARPTSLTEPSSRKKLRRSK